MNTFVWQILVDHPIMLCLFHILGKSMSNMVPFVTYMCIYPCTGLILPRHKLRSNISTLYKCNLIWTSGYLIQQFNSCYVIKSVYYDGSFAMSSLLLYPQTKVWDILDLVSSRRRRRRSNFLVSAITQKIFFTFKSNLAQLLSWY